MLPLDEVDGRGRRSRRRSSPSASWSAGRCPRSSACRPGRSGGRSVGVVLVGRPGSGARRAGRTLVRNAGSPSRGSRQSPAPPRRSGGRGCRRTRRSRGPSAGTRCRSPRWFLPNWPVAYPSGLSSSAIVGSSRPQPDVGARHADLASGRCGSTLWPVMNDDRPAVQLCSP